MPALVNRRFGASGRRLEEGTIVCCFDLKKSRNDWRISVLVIGYLVESGPRRRSRHRAQRLNATENIGEKRGAKRVEVFAGPASRLSGTVQWLSSERELHGDLPE